MNQAMKELNEIADRVGDKAKYEIKSWVLKHLSNVRVSHTTTNEEQLKYPDECRIMLQNECISRLVEMLFADGYVQEHRTSHSCSLTMTVLK